MIQKSDGADTQEQSRNTTESSFQGRGEHILLVEDDESVLSVTARLLEKCGYAVTPVLNAEDAVSEFLKDRALYALLITDAVLPGQNGLTLTRRLRVIRPELPVLVTSGYPDSRISPDAACSREYAFIRKPYGLHELLMSICRTLS
jgi:DNA-binding NtrC family response regulator